MPPPVVAGQPPTVRLRGQRHHHLEPDRKLLDLDCATQLQERLNLLRQRLLMLRLSWLLLMALRVRWVLGEAGGWQVHAALRKRHVVLPCVCKMRMRCDLMNIESNSCAPFHNLRKFLSRNVEKGLSPRTAHMLARPRDPVLDAKLPQRGSLSREQAACPPQK